MGIERNNESVGYLKSLEIEEKMGTSRSGNWGHTNVSGDRANRRGGSDPKNGAARSKARPSKGNQEGKLPQHSKDIAKAEKLSEKANKASTKVKDAMGNVSTGVLSKLHQRAADAHYDAANAHSDVVDRLLSVSNVGFTLLIAKHNKIAQTHTDAGDKHWRAHEKLDKANPKKERAGKYDWYFKP